MSDAARTREHFDATHAARADPWGVTTRWYEVRKRRILLASLPRDGFTHALELGASTGVLSEALADTADRVTALDFSVEATRLARARLSGVPGALVVTGDAVDDFPEGEYDLVVIAELGYYLDPERLSLLADRIAASLTPDGVLVACHWRHPEGDFRQTGDDVHAALDARPEWARIVHHVEDDFVLDVHSRDGVSVARATGLA
jgi:SAM-dependent methyltransferase